MNNKAEQTKPIQKILVFQQNGSGERKIAGIEKYGKGQFELKRISIESPLPPVIDDTSVYLPNKIEADLVLDFLKHPDLSHDLALLCEKNNIPIVASGKKTEVKSVLTPPTWCGLARQGCLGEYGNQFGTPEFSVTISDGKITGIEVIRGAPCGSTWEAAKRMIGLSASEAHVRMGLDAQKFCIADPAGWDPIYQKSPVHIAGELHSNAIARAVKNKS